VADCTLLFATTARAHDQAKPVVAPEAAATEMTAAIAGGATVGICFGRERYGLQNEEVALADRIVTFPVNPGFARSIWRRPCCWSAMNGSSSAPQARCRLQCPNGPSAPRQHQMQAFFDNLVRELDKVEFLRPAEKRETMLVNLRNIFTRMEPTKQDMHTLHGVVMAIAEGARAGKGGVLDGEQATRLRALLAEHGQGALPSESGTVRGIARLLRRNPTDSNAILWQALTTIAACRAIQAPDAGRPSHSRLRLVRGPRRDRAGQSRGVDVIVSDRATRKAWLEAREYRVVAMAVADVERDLATELDRLEATISEAT